MKRRDVLKGSAATAVAAATSLSRPALAAGSKVLTFAPQADLANPDPIWTTATVAAIHGYMVWDTLYGIDEGLIPQKQMLESDETSADGLTWKLKLREGLKFHDGEPVRSNDVIPSIARWGKRNGFGQQLMGLVDEMKTLDDRTVEIRLKKKFPVLPYALGANGCFVMPERMAKTDAFKQVTEYVGSGPFKFLRDEWVSGSSAAYAKFEGYVPRKEPASLWAGGKNVYIDRVEWKTMPDPATKAAALQTGEIDWWEDPIFDLLPTLQKDPNITVEVLNTLGALGIIAFNHTQPPFDNPKLLRALLPAVSQQEYIDAVLGEQKKYGNAHAGFFTPGSPYASDVGMEALDGPRNIALAKKLVAESGYKGETVLLMSPSDQPQLQVMAQVTAELFKKVGIKVDYQSMDWGTLVGRRAKRDPADKGGWNSFCTTWSGLAVSNPGGSYPMRGNGVGGWFGWPTDPGMEALRDAWFDAPDLKTQQFICMEEQLLAFHNIPFMPVGHWTTPSAFRKNITDVVKSSPVVFWNLRKG